MVSVFRKFLGNANCCNLVNIVKVSRVDYEARLNAIAMSQQHETPEMKEHTYDPAAFTVIAAMHAAMNKVFSEKTAPSAVAAALIKFVGKGHGTLAVANLASRNAAWALPIGEAKSGLQLKDPVIRFEDALAAAVMIKMHITSQLYTEAAIQSHKTSCNGGVGITL